LEKGTSEGNAWPEAARTKRALHLRERKEVQEVLPWENNSFARLIIAMPHAHTEDPLVEPPAIGLFAELGWTTLSALKIHPQVDKLTPSFHRAGRTALFLVMLFTLVSLSSKLRADDVAESLPEGVKAVWDITKAYRETTPSRERICLNGLWRWQPADTSSDQVPAGSWGFFKVPGCWPGITDYLQKDSQTLFTHQSWKDVKLGGISAAWYERELSVPSNWSGRRISLSIEYLNSYAMVFVDGVKTGEVHFPGGEVDLTTGLAPGTKHRLSLLVVALPLKGVMLSYTDSASAREVKGKVERRRLCGDVYLVSMPRGPKITDVNVGTSVRKRELTINAAVESLEPNGHYTLRTRIMKDGSTVKEFASLPFQDSDPKDGRIEFTKKWMPDKLWDINTPQNAFDIQVSLIDASGQQVDTDWPQRFGFREFWIDGRDFYLNGTRIFLSAVPLDNAQVAAVSATYEATRESLERLKSFGINYVYTHNYGCEPGSHLSFTEILRAADDAGMLVGFTQPHFSHYDWKASDADQNNGYARHAAFYARAAGNHPSVVMLRDEPQRHRLRRGHEPGHDRRDSRGPRPMGGKKRQAGDARRSHCEAP
jgi:beta-galactosidase